MLSLALLLQASCTTNPLVPGPRQHGLPHAHQQLPPSAVDAGTRHGLLAVGWPCAQEKRRTSKDDLFEDIGYDISLVQRRQRLQKGSKG